MGIPEQSTPPRGIWLPETIPLENFSHVFYGKVALHFWQHPELVSLSEAVVPVAETLSDEELLAIADLVEEDTYMADEEYNSEIEIPPTMWSEPKHLRIRNGRVIGDIGSPKNVINYLRALDRSFGGYDNDFLCEALYEAADKYGGQEFVEFLQEMMVREVTLRLNRDARAPEPNNEPFPEEPPLGQLFQFKRPAR